MTRIRLTTTLLLAAFLPLSCHAQFPAAPGTGPGLPETIEAIDAARVTTRILYVTAHPDDESAAVLTYLARGLHADVALLSITRGEGGQNALGPEQAPQLGLIRTQELLAATRGYGVKLYFTRAKDFGFSKTPEETERIWGDAVMQDMVRVIREFRPNIVINGWGGVHGGHGHHQVSGIWTPQAVKHAADATYLADSNFPMWDNNGQGVKILDVERGGDNPKGYVLPVDDIDPLYGKSYREIGLDAFVNHRTQGIAGFINSPFLRRPVALLPEDGSKLDPAILHERLVQLPGWRECRHDPNGCDELKTADDKILAARNAALSLDWPTATKELDLAQKLVGRFLPPADTKGVPWSAFQYTADAMHSRIIEAMLLAAGFKMTAEADRAETVIGEPVKVKVTYACRMGVECPVETSYRERKEQVLKGPVFFDHAHVLEPVPASADFKPGAEFNISISAEDVGSGTERIQPEPQISEKACVKIALDDHFLHFSTHCVPTLHTEATSTNVTQVPIRLVPAYTVKVDPGESVALLHDIRKSFDVFLRVHSYSRKPAEISVGLETPDGFTATAPVELSFDGIGDQYAKLTVTPPVQLAAGNYILTAYAKRGDEKFTTTLEPLPTMPAILWSEPAQTVVHAFDITVPPNLRVGYISAEGEMIPEALRRLGISVEMLDANALNFGDLSRYSAIVVGVRAYELRPELASANKRLLDYVSSGGTLLVQYNRDYIWNKILPAPYHATIGNPTPRITDENAEVKFLKPEDRLLNWPNKITSADFQGWVQERGLYYWSDFDSKYTALLSMHDPGESDLTGGLVYTPYGKGTYIYTGLAFFRELPEGIPGAYRLFVNLLSASAR